MDKKVVLRRSLTALFYVALAAALVIYLLNVDLSALATLSPSPVWLLISVVLALGFRFWQVYVWLTVLRGLGAKDARMSPELVEVYAKSWLGRYIPGTAPWILGKIFFASQYGISKARLAVGSLLEGVIQIAVLLALSSLMLLFDPRLDVLGQTLRIIMIVAIVGSIVALIPPVFNFGMSLLFRILRRGKLAAENRANGKTIIIASLQYVVGALLSGASLFFVVKAVYPEVDWADTTYVMASSNLASASSMLAVFVPGGLGVREGVQLTLLSVVIPSAIALVVVVFTRLWAIAMDLVFFALGKIILAIAKRRRGPEPEPALPAE